MEDNELLAKILCKDEQAFQIFTDKYRGLFYSIAEKVLEAVASHEDIEDCLSDSLAYIWLHANQYNPEKYSFRAWCSLIVVSRAKNQYVAITRHFRRLELVKEDKQMELRYVPSAEDTHLENESDKKVLQIIASLPQPERDIFIHRYLYDRRPKEIAEKFNMTPKDIDKYLRRAKRLLKKGGVGYEDR